MLARILTSLSSSGQSWQPQCWVTLGEGRSDEGYSLLPMPAWFYSRFKCGIVELLLGTHEEDLPLRRLALEHSTKLVLRFSYLTPREHVKVVTVCL